MSKKLSSVLILCMSAVSLSGCSWFRVTGPCYGVGCPAGASGHAGQYKPGEAPKAQNAPARIASAPGASPHPQSAAATQSQAAESVTTPAASAQAAPAPDASAEAKPSPLHSIGEFFTHLIPHHNNGAKSGATD